MSIPVEIKRRACETRLVQFRPELSSSTPRPLYLFPDVDELVTEPWEDDVAEELAAVRVDFENYTMGGQVTATFKPTPNADLKRLQTKAKDVWEIRIQSPALYRLFGFFAEQDVFIGFALWERDHVDFDRDIEDARKVWAELFPNNTPLVSENINDYISEAVVFLR